MATYKNYLATKQRKTRRMYTEGAMGGLTTSGADSSEIQFENCSKGNRK